MITGRPRLMAPMVVNPDMVIVGRDGGKVTYWDTASGRRCALPGAVAEVLERSRGPAGTPVGAAWGDGPGSDGLAGALGVLRDAGVLVEQGAPDPAAAPCDVGCHTGTGLFGYHRVPLPSALRDRDVSTVVVGMPYDAGVTAKPGTRFGPAYIRNASRTLFRQDPPGDTAGMHDPVRGRRVLRGAGIADVGDLSAAVHTRNGETMDELHAVVSAIACAGKVPVVLGGDHSITLPSVRAVLGSHQKLGILHFDAHADYRRPRRGDWRLDCHHGNFMDWLVGDERVARVAQFGVRQLLADPVEPHQKLIVWPGLAACRADLGAVLATLPAELPYYVTVDVDVLDPVYMPSTGAPLPGGFTLPQLEDLVDGLCAARNIVGLDVVEYLPDGHPGSAPAVAQILLRLLDGALAGAAA